MNNEEEYIEIDLKELMFYILRRWKQIVVVGLILAVLLGSLKAVQEYQTGNEPEQGDANWVDIQQYNDQLQLYKDLIVQTQDKIDTQQEYVDHSVMMKADYRNVYIAKVTYYVDSGYQILPENSYQNTDKTETLTWHYRNYLQDYSVYEALSQEVGVEARFLMDLIEISVPTSNTISLTVYHPYERSAKLIMEALEHQMATIQDHLNNTVEDHTLSLMLDTCGVYVYEELKARQQNVYDEMLAYQEELITYKQKLHDLEENEPDQRNPVTAFLKWAAIGGVVGCALVVGLHTVVVLLGGKVYAPKEMSGRYGIPLLGMVCHSEKKQDKVTVLLRKLEGRLEKNSEENNRYLAESLRSRCGEARNILVCSDQDQGSALVGEILRNRLPDLEIQFVANPQKDAASLHALVNCEQVVLVVVSEQSKNNNVDKIMELVRDYRKSVLGCIFVD